MGYVEFPSHCLSASMPVCHFGTVKKTSTYDQDKLRVYLGNETLLKKENAQIEWVYGSVLFEVESKTEVYFKSHSIVLQKGKYLFFGQEGDLKVDVLDGELTLGKYRITEGFQCAFSIVAGQLKLKPLQAIDLKEHVVRYVKVRNLTRLEAGKYMDEFVPKYKNYIAWIGELNNKLIKRSIAQDRNAQRRERHARLNAQMAEEKRKLDFFNKVFAR